MRVLGVDPGLATTGWGVLEKGVKETVALASGYISTKPKQRLVDRLAAIYDQLNKVIDTYSPDVLAIEELFFTKHTAAILSIGQARGVILLLSHKKGLTVYEYNPRSIKIALTGFGGAEKSQMQHMVTALLKLPVIPEPDDVADALAVAVCHLNSIELAKRLECAK